MPRYKLRTLLIVFALGPPLGVSAIADSSDARFDGTWVLVSHVESGRELIAGARKLDHDRIVIRDNEIHSPFIVRGENELTRHRFTLSIDGSVSPGRCDLVITAIDVNGTSPIRTAVLPGVFTSGEKELKLCFAEAGQRRPTGFEAREGWSILTFERAPPH